MQSKEFRALRESLNISMRRIGDKFGASPQSVHYFEVGHVSQPEWRVQDAASWMREIAERRDVA